MDKELIILEQIQNNPHVNQRDLASIAQASLGMTNAILKRFAEKGLITIKKVNNRNIHYILTAEGIEEVSKRSWSYFKRTIKNVVVYQDAIREIIKQAKADGYDGIALIGESDFTFIIEHICYKQCFPFQVIKNGKPIENWFQFNTENADDLSEDVNSFPLSRLITK